ncbi:hypothetical protein WR25_13415 [Diploscapter pachys]|uniref:CB1 cannabinoid receptor-interacting protein 1 n=1 Tax=Diploscapter pachys TaxID=2018661 RepID=A0A2A2KMC2_9BILA|nr:hypothetical protein WR25_13415 [Diploscapter pachys]
MNFREIDNGDPIAFKVDGQRFETSQKTLKFATNNRYKVSVTTKPPVDLCYANLGGCDLQLHSSNPKSGEYTAEWNTTGCDGPCGIMKRQLQCKFYSKDDSHAYWGHKLSAIQLNCYSDGSGNVNVTEEEIK